MKWTLAEGIQKLLPTNQGNEPEINDLGISKRQLCLDVSIAEGQTEDGENGISVILSTLGEEEGTYMHLSGMVTPNEGESLQDLVVRVAAMLGVDPNEHVWEDGEGL